jgi:hypothetical protein
MDTKEDVAPAELTLAQLPSLRIVQLCLPDWTVVYYKADGSDATISTHLAMFNPEDEKQVHAMKDIDFAVLLGRSKETIRTLKISDKFPITPGQLDKIADWAPHLVELFINGRATLAELTKLSIGRMPKLTSLSIDIYDNDDCPKDDVDIKNALQLLNRFPDLEKVELSVDVPTAELRVMVCKNLSQRPLKRLYLCVNVWPGEPLFEDKLAETLEEFNYNIDIDGLTEEDADPEILNWTWQKDIAALFACKNLKRFKLGHYISVVHMPKGKTSVYAPSLSSEEIKTLSQFPSIRFLTLRNTFWTPEQIYDTSKAFQCDTVNRIEHPVKGVVHKLTSSADGKRKVYLCRLY